MSLPPSRPTYASSARAYNRLRETFKRRAVRSAASKTRSGRETETFIRKSMKDRPSVASSIARQKARGSFDLGFRRKEDLLEWGRVGDRRVEGTDHADGGVQELEGLLLDDGRQAFSDPAGAR